nr:uncharacterized protein LOC107280284 [Oryza sativa Japonica Group]
METTRRSSTPAVRRNSCLLWRTWVMAAAVGLPMAATPPDAAAMAVRPSTERTAVAVVPASVFSADGRPPHRTGQQQASSAALLPPPRRPPLSSPHAYACTVRDPEHPSLASPTENSSLYDRPGTVLTSCTIAVSMPDTSSTARAPPGTASMYLTDLVVDRIVHGDSGVWSSSSMGGTSTPQDVLGKIDAH